MIAFPVYFAYETVSLAQLYETLKSEVQPAGANGEVVISKPTGFRRIVGNGGKPEHILILNINEPKSIPSINLDVFYVSIFPYPLGSPELQRAERLSLSKWPEPHNRNLLELRRPRHQSRALLRNGKQWECSYCWTWDQQNLFLLDLLAPGSQQL